MNKLKFVVILIAACFAAPTLFAQNKNAVDSLQTDSLRRNIENLLQQQRQQQQLDSLMKAQLQNELQLATGDKQKTKELEDRLRLFVTTDSIHKAQQLLKIAELKKNATGFAVVPFTDTLFFIYTKVGSFSPRERAQAINERIKKLYNAPFYNADSLKINETENGFDVLYNNETLILTVTGMDALWLGADPKQLTSDYVAKIKKNIAAERDANSLKSWLRRIGLVCLIILSLSILVFFVNKLFKLVINFRKTGTHKYVGGLTIRKIKILSAEQLQLIELQVSNVLRIILLILIVYLSLPLLFSVFPETKAWTDILLGWILTPARSAMAGVFHFLPNLFTILVIYFIFRYTIKGFRYFVDEIEKGNITLSGFHADWAQPTFNIVKFLLYAFMIVLIFPYLPGSKSVAFQGVSVFVGVILSLGSSNAIANMVAGMVITYMRPFKIGDRIKIGDITGDVIEKTMLVTRIRTSKNEDITIPNSTVLSGSTINYSSNTKPADKGVILHTTVTIGYDVPWRDVHKALINAGLRTEFILNDPMPFVLQTSLDDFYVSYQLNAHTKEANRQSGIYSQLHQNIQDCCNEAGIEIMSPHYRAARDGNGSTIPTDYLDKNYKAPPFNIKVTKDGTGHEAI